MAEEIIEPQEPELPPVSKKNVARKTIFASLPAAIIVIAVIAATCMLEIESDKTLNHHREANIIRLQKLRMASELDTLTSDILYLSKLDVTSSAVNNLDDKPSRDRLAKHFLDFISTRSIYDQIRIIDAEGMERIRVNLGNKSAYVVEESKLQNKKDRYYFIDTMKLQPGQIFASPMDLNIENGKIEQPYKPMIRLGTPLLDSEGKTNAVLVINYKAQSILDKCAETDTRSSKILLLNMNGFFLKGLSHTHEWAFMYEGPKTLTFEKFYPEANKTVYGQEEGQLTTDNGLFTFTTIRPLMRKNLSSTVATGNNTSGKRHSIDCADYYWKMVSYVPIKALTAKTNKWITFSISVSLLVFFGVIFSAWRMAAAEELKSEIKKANKDQLQLPGI